MFTWKRCGGGIAALALACGLGVGSAAAGEVQIMHYFTGDLGLKGMTAILKTYQEQTGAQVVDNPIGHEEFKSSILVMAAGKKLPDLFSYWAGARTQFIIDGGGVGDIDSVWAAAKLDEVVPAAVASGATVYNGKHYLLPLGYHYAGLFYNKKLLDGMGITEGPKTWDDLLAMAEKINAAGVKPFALGSKDRWPAQFWFDYLLLRTAGPDYRQKLMTGAAHYTDPEVKAAMALWKQLVDAGYFTEFANADGWTDAADKVARGEAAFTLMGTWITGYWDGNGLKAGEDYDFFPFPEITAGVPNAVVGPVDGLLTSATPGDQAAVEALLAYLITDIGAQTTWATTQGALSPNANVDVSIYSPVMKKALDTVAAAESFAFNYDLATPPPAAEAGLNMFAQFMDDAGKYEDYLAATETAVQEALKAK
jgi:multiple sugar transport system substrate-binding protein/raffinose/stachyose/melibiose transport system substrate-binding protein